MKAIILLLLCCSCAGFNKAWNEQECDPYVVEYYNEKTKQYGMFESPRVYYPGTRKRIEFYGPKVLILDIKLN